VNNQGGGTLTLADSTLSGNVAAFNGGGMANSGTATLQRSTVFGNIANTGGGLYTLGGMQAYQVTLSRNHANSYGGGIVSKGSGALLTFGNNLIVGNDAVGVDGQEIYAATTNGFSGISNVVGQNGVASVYPSTPTGFQVNPMSRDQTLNPLTPTLAARPLCTLPRGSFAIDAGDDRVATNNGVTFDAKGADVGAVQYETYHRLRVAKTGNGTVGSSPGSLVCGANCAENFLGGSTVTLTATPGAGYRLFSWGGACTGTAVTSACKVLMNSDQTATATFSANGALLTVVRTGSGTVTGTGISCGTDCTERYALNTAVTLRATPTAGYRLGSWGGACIGTAATLPCTVLMNAAKTVTASFVQIPATYLLTVQKAGLGSGTVTSNPAGISCGAVCVKNYASGTSVILTATPAAGSTFAGWTGCTVNPANTRQCTVAMNAAKTVTARFALVTYWLTVQKTGTGSGAVTSNPAGISCGAVCAKNYASGTSVTLTATPAAGSTFAGWSGACSGTGICTVAMNAAKTVTASFSISGSNPYPVAKTGQTTTYADRDDGALQKGVAWPNPRFTDQGDGTVTDNLTGLVWLKNADCAGEKTWDTAMTWAAALTSGSCGLSDGSTAGQWRLPTREELNSLVDSGASFPALPTGHPFTGVQSDYYWSSTSDASDTSLAWLVNINDGYVNLNGKANDYYVWPVRGGL
jgi:hypothetical protein